ncbi:Hsp20/alpha crystallin family protein [Subsaxibacter sp. CAU 1640]|uniref:Hsp20/alpha crystallin family protein n=1 Tax=Subsaxibacter sp. CAU 1640 TaxID=2933271 RepID=UPI00200541F2|nr:Hsp20/alpha crystallin family protein [Subsaxibacter sp. CAU 1640]MCK7590963.1 Hsp20/alpha crystallin family protein [Subsaxibacter sp. CAU 1640]
MTTLVKMPRNGSEVSTQRNRSSLPSLSSWVDDLFETGLGTGFLSNFNTGMTLPAVNIKENKDEYFLEIAVPGMKKSDFNINVENKVLSISSEKSEETVNEDENYTRKEFGYSSFKRTFTLPDTVESENINAKYNDGILTIHLPKREEAKEKPAKRIDVS